MKIQTGEYRFCILKFQKKKKENYLVVEKVKFNLSQSLQPQLIPIGFLKSFSQEMKEHLKWIAQKDKMCQDIFLIGHPGSFRRKYYFSFSRKD